MPVYYVSLDLSGKEKSDFFACAAGGGFAAGMLFYDSPAIGLLLAAAAFLYYPHYRKSMAEKKRGTLLIQFRDMLYSVSSSVSAGRNMTRAMEESIDFWKNTYEEKDYIMKELKYMTGRIKNSNERDVDVLRDFAARSGLDDVWDFVNVYECCRRTGGNLTEAISRATTIIGDKINMEKELKSMMAQKAFESRVVMVMPAVIVGFLRIMSPEYMKPMMESSQGRVVTTFALGLMVAAFVWMERINRIEI